MNTVFKQVQFRISTEQLAKLAALVAERRKLRGKVYTRSDAMRQALQYWLDSHTHAV